MLPSSFLTSNMSANTNPLLLRLVERASRIISVIGYLAGPVCVAFAIGLVSFCSFTYFTVVLPFHAQPVVSVWWWLHVMFAVFCVYNIFWNYYHGIKTSPGYSPAVCT
jgi:hypothetical protein